MDERTKMLVAVGASTGANCHPCLEYHIGKAIESGIAKSEILEAVNAAKAVRGGAAASVDKLALKLLGSESTRSSCDSSAASSCCCS